MFRRSPSVSHDDTAYTMDEAEALTAEIDRVNVSGDTALMPPVPIEPDPADPVTEVIPPVVQTPAQALSAGLDVTMETPEPDPAETSVDAATVHRRKIQEQREAERRRPPKWRPQGAPVMSMQMISEKPPLRPRARPRTLESWRATLADIQNDGMTPVYVLLILAAAVFTCWATTVIFKPEWVPQVINPRPVHPSTSPASYRPEREPDAPVPHKPLRSTERPVQVPAAPRHETKAPRPSEAPRSGSQSPSASPSVPQAPSTSPSAPTDSSPPSEPTRTPSDPTTPTHEPPTSHEPTDAPTSSKPDSPSPSASRTVSDSPEPPQVSHTASEPAPTSSS